MMLNSEMIVRHLSAGELQVISPPNVGLMLCFAAVSLVPAAYFIYRAIRTVSAWPLIGIALFSLPFGLVALGVHRNGSVLLDRAANLATITRPSWLWHETFTFPLSDIQYAEVHSRRNGTSVALVLQSGNSVGFSDFTDQSGKGHAAQAINDYLGAPRR